MIFWTNAGLAETARRLVCSKAEKLLGQPIVIDYKMGASGVIALNYVAKSKPDGYTLGGTVTSTYLISPHMRALPYNVHTDFTDIITIAQYTFGLAVRADAPWKTYEDVIAYARKNPGKFTYSCIGVGVTQHLTMEQIARKEGIQWTLIPFKNSGECITAVLGGHADAVVQASIDIVPQIQAKKLKLLLSLNKLRWPDIPDVPHIGEKGYDFEATSHISFYGPKGLPEAIRQELEDVFRKATKDPSYVELMKEFKVVGSDMGGKEYSALWRSQYDEMGKIVKSLGLEEK
jgi:tripartite-type tricarboxylate transporter receptor subunit TctC